METLPEWFDIEFSAATGDWIELYQIQSWSFSSSDVDEVVGSEVHEGGGGRRIAIGLPVSMAGLISVLGMVVLGIWRRRRRRRWRRETVEDLNVGVSMDNEFQKEPAQSTRVAVKRVAQGSKQGKKECMADVKIISPLRHRNLVQLVGWCHEPNEFLLVYDFMPNGSLDSHLFRGKSLLHWLGGGDQEGSAPAM